MRFLEDYRAAVKSFEEMSGRKPYKDRTDDRKAKLDNAVGKVEVRQKRLFTRLLS